MAKFVLAHYELTCRHQAAPPRVHVTIPYETLVERSGQALLADHYLAPDAARRLACDAGVHRMITHSGSAVIDYGRQTRTVSDSLWNLLVERDGGCRFPGCEIPPRCATPTTPNTGPTTARPAKTISLSSRLVRSPRDEHEQLCSLEPLGAGHFMLRSPTDQIYEFGPPRLNKLSLFTSA